MLVLPSTGEFDSRTYRIATAALARGHTVTVLARWKAGLPEREIDPAGYEIIRIRTDPGEALPGRDMARKVIRMGDRAGSEDRMEDEDGAAADEDGDEVGAPGSGVDGRVAAGTAPAKHQSSRPFHHRPLRAARCCARSAVSRSDDPAVGDPADDPVAFAARS